jgi:hypothetical protein
MLPGIHPLRAWLSALRTSMSINPGMDFSSSRNSCDEMHAVDQRFHGRIMWVSG